MLTPLDIQNKHFPRTFRGYNENEVEEYMALIVRSMEDLIQINIDNTARLADLEVQNQRYQLMEKTIHEAMVLAQRTSEDMIHNANEKAAFIVASAEDQARKVLEDANRGVLETIRKHEAAKFELRSFATKFRVLLESQLQSVDHMTHAENLIDE